MRDEFLVTNEPATDDQVLELLRVLKVSLPDSYIAFLKGSNGAEGGPNDAEGDSLKILTSSEIQDWNIAYGFPARLPGLLAFASDGGDYAFCFNRESSSNPNCWVVERVPLGAMAAEECQFVASCFPDWERDGFRYHVQ